MGVVCREGRRWEYWEGVRIVSECPVCEGRGEVCADCGASKEACDCEQITAEIECPECHGSGEVRDD